MCDLSTGVILNDVDRPLTSVSKSRYLSKVNLGMSENCMLYCPTADNTRFT